MDGFTYHDIFATKGIEYLIVISFFLILVPFWMFLNKPTRAALKSIGRTIADIGRWFFLPEKAYFHQGHTWAIPNEDGTVTVGMDDFAQKLIGKCDSISLPHLGTSLSQGDLGWHLTSDGKKIPMLTPISGEVVAINPAIQRSLGLVNEDPYGEGWIMKIKPKDAKREIKHLLTGNLAASWMDDVVKILQGEMSGALGTVLADGGQIVTGFARQIARDNWDDLAKRYLLSGDHQTSRRS